MSGEGERGECSTHTTMDNASQNSPRGELVGCMLDRTLSTASIRNCRSTTKPIKTSQYTLFGSLRRNVVWCCTAGQTNSSGNYIRVSFCTAVSLTPSANISNIHTSPHVVREYFPDDGPAQVEKYCK